MLLPESSTYSRAVALARPGASVPPTPKHQSRRHGSHTATTRLALQARPVQAQGVLRSGPQAGLPHGSSPSDQSLGSLVSDARRLCRAATAGPWGVV
jgi:hypothetical protein